VFSRPTDDPTGAKAVTIHFEGVPVRARAGESVAGTLLAAGHLAFRETVVSGAARGPFCMMGACFDCLVEIDGRPALDVLKQDVGELLAHGGVRRVLPELTPEDLRGLRVAALRDQLGDVLAAG